MGHLDVITRASRLFSEVLVAVLHNPDKQGMFTAVERVQLAAASTSHLPNVRVAAYANQLLVDVCAAEGIAVTVKGLRGETDFSYEMPMAAMNRQLGGIETLLLPGDPQVAHYSSSLIKQVAAFGADISAMVPPAVHTALQEKLAN